MESPILWEYRSLGNGNYNLRIATEASHFDGVQVADEFYYRYIDPATENADEGTHGVRDESAQNTDLSSTCTLQYEAASHRLVSGSEYIGVGDVNGKLHITGKNTEANAAEVYFARVTSVPAPDVDKHPDHTVNHIDISVTGSSSVTVPLAYGDYYDASGKVIYRATEADHKITMSKSIDITKEDIKKATITAFIKNADGTQTEVPNAYYVTGYSGNGENDPNQVRIEGSFKVANLPSIPNADDLESVRNARLQNKIYYTVSTVSVFESLSADSTAVIGKGVNSPISETDLANLINNNGYAEIHKKDISIGESGIGAIYDYDIRTGMIYIMENPDSVDKFIRDIDGKVYEYVSTRMETEYVWRQEGDKGKLHHSNGFTSVPEVVGTYGTDLKNMFLEFSVYNVYKPVSTVDVPVSKAWDDFDGDGYDWSVTFRLQWAPKYNEGGVGPDDDFADYYLQVKDAQPTAFDMTITKSQMANPEASLNDRTFHNLPKYGVDSSGRSYRIIYSLEEMAYSVTHNDETIASFDRASGTYVPSEEDEQYEAFYPHDAGEWDAEDTDYYIESTNHKKNITDEQYIDVTVTKAWEDKDGNPITPDGWETQFQLLRYKGTGYRDISHVVDPDASPITVALGDKSIQVIPGTGVRMVFVIGAHTDERKLSYSANGEDPIEIYHEYYQGGPYTFITGTIYPTVNTTITYSGTAQVLSADVIDTMPGTEPAEDTVYAAQNHTFTLNSDHPSATFHLLRSNVSAGADDGQQNINYFEYYFKELFSNPDGYYVTFTDSDGHSFGTADSRITANTELTATNRPTPPFIVKKAWRGVPEDAAYNYPEIKFSLYQAETWNDNYQNPQSAWVYVDEFGNKYENIALNADNNWTWNCPVKLPDKLKNGHDAKYYVVETTTSGSIGRTQWELYGYSTEFNEETNRYDKIGNQSQPHNVNIQKNNDNEISGVLIIHNTLKDYMELDVKKKYIDFSHNRWDTLTTDVNKNTVLGFKVIRKTYDTQGNVLVDWEDYGTEMLVGYDSNGQNIQSNEGNTFWLQYAGVWHWTIHQQGGDLNGEHIGLPKHGFYSKEDGEIVSAIYAYSIRETGVYADLERTPWKDLDGEEWDWWSTLTPPHAFSGDPGVVPNEQFYQQEDYPVSDSDRVNNYKASDLRLEKAWLGNADNAVKEIYVKIYRYDGQSENTVEDFTAIIADDVKNNNNWQGYLKDPTKIDADNEWLILDNTNGWSSDVIIQSALIGSMGHSGAAYVYHYYAVEVGYKDADGIVHTVEDLEHFDPRYDKQVDNSWQNTPHTNPVWAQMAIGAVGQNAIRIINAPVTDFEAKKEWLDMEGNPLSDDLIKDKTATFKVKQYYTTSTKEEAGIVVPDWDGNVESRILTFVENKDAETGTQALTIGKTAVAFKAVVVSGSHDKYVLTSVAPSQSAQDWTLQLDGLQAMYVDDSGHVYYCRYELVETASSGFVVTYEGNEITYGGYNHVTITNTESDLYELTVLKVDKNNSETKLKGAKFTIRKLVETNASTIETDTSFTPYDRTTDVSGNAVFDNLPVGIYEISETGLPVGYVLSDFRGKAYIKVSSGGSVSLIKSEEGIAPTDWAALPETDPDAGYLNITVSGLTVKNEPGVALPKTGGQGTGIFGTFGGILILAGAYLLTKRKKQ